MNIRFANREAFERFRKCSEMTNGLNDRSLDSCVMRLMKWHPYDGTITISCDFDELSFFFSEVSNDGKSVMCGGIIFHGHRDNGGDGRGPTFSVNLTPMDGYAIHT